MSISPPFTRIHDDLIKPGDIWYSIREKHFDKQVKVVSSNAKSVNVVVTKGGNNQNSRKARGKPEHIGRDVFLAHYTRLTRDKPTTKLTVKDAIAQVFDQHQENPVMTTTMERAEDVSEHAAEPVSEDVPATNESLPMADLPHPTFSQKTYDFDIAGILERTVRFLKRRGEPVKSYVIIQNVAKALNKVRTPQLIEYGVQLGLLDTWTTPADTHRPSIQTVWVGLPGQRPANLPTTPTSITTTKTKQEHRMATTTVNTKEAQADRARATIQRQYDALSGAARSEIAQLLQLPDTRAQEVQKAYGIMGGVIGLIKREFGMTTVRASKPAKPQQGGRRARRVKPWPTTATTPPQVTVNLTGTDAVTAASEVGTPAYLDAIRDRWNKHAAELAAMFEQSVPDVAQTGANGQAADESAKLAGSHTFTVTMMVMTPTEATVTVAASSFEEALRLIREGRYDGPMKAYGSVKEIISVSKTT